MHYTLALHQEFFQPLVPLPIPYGQFGHAPMCLGLKGWRIGPNLHCASKLYRFGASVTKSAAISGHCQGRLRSARTSVLCEGMMCRICRCCARFFLRSWSGMFYMPATLRAKLDSMREGDKFHVLDLQAPDPLRSGVSVFDIGSRNRFSSSSRTTS